MLDGKSTPEPIAEKKYFKGHVFEVVDLFDEQKLRTGNFPKDEEPTLLKKFSLNMTKLALI